MDRFLAAVMAAALAADRDRMSQVDWKAHGIEAGPYSDRTMVFGYDWEVDVRVMEVGLALFSQLGFWPLRDEDLHAGEG